jgi:hypothetical protein
MKNTNKKVDKFDMFITVFVIVAIIISVVCTIVIIWAIVNGATIDTATMNRDTVNIAVRTVFMR